MGLTEERKESILEVAEQQTSSTKCLEESLKKGIERQEVTLERQDKKPMYQEMTYTGGSDTA